MPSGFTLTKRLRHEDNHAQRLFTYAPSLREAPLPKNPLIREADKSQAYFFSGGSQKK
ncbi:hypothetical protein POREN0001_0420 [Porphyromonas endodontalis ATCC 35406]|uniref:Uncharacterized protein n=1 Tax=Porphyromonas endodontalis (strain ATCC 35406 / DSM 24491 / JCM 8526 / CCUG 16442 / BCRC 14492 / NCTC 13058 / HG 370) TaxID=553175 RepID=C3JC22_POREA|nr:hypothetical protein POREN0001_0420 [Porphyromonas endodontalis ATCC 35406]SUB67750.1 Uncharacterised protein [Porphyromonas endodontalis]